MQKIKIPVHHYTEITKHSRTAKPADGVEYYLTNTGGKLYLVEVWR